MFCTSEFALRVTYVCQVVELEKDAKVRTYIGTLTNDKLAEGSRDLL